MTEGYRGAYLKQVSRIWRLCPNFMRRSALGRSLGGHLHRLVLLSSERQQYFATYFLRNRAELRLIQSLVNKKPPGSEIRISVLACSKGAEVYSIVWAIRSVRPDLKLTVRAIDISPEILKFAERGVYVRADPDQSPEGAAGDPVTTDVARNTNIDQGSPIFERMSTAEMQALFEIEGDHVRVRSWLRQGVSWLCADAGHPDLPGILGPQDIVVANRFLCHMSPENAERCLRNIARLAGRGGYAFVSGIDLDVRTRVAQSLGWTPVPDMIREIHEGDTSLMKGWPLEYWGLEPFDESRPDWRMRFAAAFQIGTPVRGSEGITHAPGRVVASSQ